MRGEPLPSQMKIKSKSGDHKSENKGENAGHKKFSQGGAQTEKAKSGSGDKYIKVGATRSMHGKSVGGHPSIRSGEFSDKGMGHHIKPISYKGKIGNE